MMLSKIKNLRYTNKIYLTHFIYILSVFICANSQEIIKDKIEQKLAKSITDSTTVIKLDGVAAVVGDFVILDSDIDKQFAQLEASGISTKEITRCQLFGKLMEDKLYVHHAIQDSVEINDIEIRSYVDQQIEAFSDQIGSMEKKKQEGYF